MYPPGKYPLYQYTMEEREEILKARGLDECRIKEDVKIIEDWFYKQAHLAEAGIERKLIELTLLCCKGSVEITKRKIDSYYRHRYYSPEIFQARINLLNDSEADVFGAFYQAPMPKLFKGQRITFSGFTNPDNTANENIFINSFMLADIRFLNDFMAGDIWVLDLNNLTIGHVAKFNWSILQKTAKILQESSNIKVNAIHLINCSMTTIVKFLLNVLKQVLSQKLFGRIKFHKSLEDLYEDIPREYLPKDYGGEMPSTSEIKDKYLELIKSDDTRKFLIDACKYVSDETKRPKDFDDYITGTFRQLSFD